MRGLSYLLDTPPHCPTPACYVHGVPEQEHHVEGCPMYDTLANRWHHLDHALGDAAEAFGPHADAIVAVLARTWRGRLALLRWRLFGKNR